LGRGSVNKPVGRPFNAKKSPKSGKKSFPESEPAYPTGKTLLSPAKGKKGPPICGRG